MYGQVCAGLEVHTKAFLSLKVNPPFAPQRSCGYDTDMSLTVGKDQFPQAEI